MAAVNSQEKVVLSKGDGVEEDITLDYGVLRKAVLTLRAVNHKLRKQIINLLEDSSKLTVTEIYVKLRIEQSVASQHPAILRNEGFVNTEREGKTIWYSVSEETIKSFVAHAAEVLDSSVNNAA